ncbi:hypothetical protein CAEBREN_06638 [Caenorhabditis brenneri]|uniref:Uncharacterized protein n=1 Tax=Caenorhabditis brenneri TaxID=135651 RepID=G0N0R0_CAEBE|nr:hypothetical protein CAEBREN_06638 [Caenorhabditis brenneri]
MSMIPSDDDEENQIKFAIPNTGLADGSEWLQYLNRLVSLIACMTLHFYIITKLAVTNKCSKMNDYQILIVIQSVINVFACLFELILNEVVSSSTTFHLTAFQIQTQNLLIVKIGHPFWQFSLNESLLYTIAMAVSSNSTQDFLMLFNLHRLTLIKHGNLLRVYLIATPLMLIGIVADIKDSYSLVLKGQDINLFYKYGQVPIITTVIVFCYWKLNREFALNKSLSEKTKKLQQKLSKSILIQIIMLLIVSFLVNVIPWLVEKVGDPTFYTKYIVTYIVISLVITQWYLFISAVLIFWSINGFFQNQNTSVAPLKIFQDS